MKISVNGFEGRVLMGARELLLSGLVQQIVFSDFNPDFVTASGVSVEKMINVLRATGYEVLLGIYGKPLPTYNQLVSLRAASDAGVLIHCIFRG
jgi:hypothetical protein